MPYNVSLYFEYLKSGKSYYNEYLNAYGEKYHSCHGYLSLILCTIGVMLNSINIVMFSRKNMLSSTNVILTALATADLVIVLLYIPFAYLRFFLVYPGQQDVYIYVLQDSYDLSYFFLIFHSSTKVCHAISAWLTVMLAVWRFIAISCPLYAVRSLTIKRTRYVVLTIFAISICVLIPQYLSNEVKEYPHGAIPLYTIGPSEFSLRHNMFFNTYVFWVIDISLQILPCTLLVFFTLALIKVLHQVKAQRRNLTATAENDSEIGKINKMLLLILLLFLFSELPSAVFILLFGVLNSDFYNDVYAKLAETIDLLDLLNHSINGIIYYTMIRKYKETFNSVFNCRICGKVNNIVWLSTSSQMYNLESISQGQIEESTSQVPHVKSATQAHHVESAL